MKPVLSIVLYLLIVSIGCKSPYVVSNHSPQQLTEKQAKSFVEEMYYQGIPQKCTNVEISNESIKATFDYATSVRDYKMGTSNSFADKNVESIFFKQIQAVTLNTGQTSSTKGKYVVAIATRTNNYLFNCTNQSLARNFIDALEYYRRK